MAEYIDREKMLKYLEKTNTDNDWVVGQYNADWIYSFIESQPTADVEEVRHGQWLPQIVSGVKVWDCSECKTLGSPHWKRCPICEAKMDGGKAE